MNSDLKLSMMEHSKKNYLDPKLYSTLPYTHTITGQDALRSCSQGPAAYNSMQAFKTLTQKTTVKAMRPCSQEAHRCNFPQPGPQTYNIPAIKHPGGYMSTTSHDRYKQDYQTGKDVGPGSYELAEANDRRKGFTIKGKIKEAVYVNENGPGSYDIAEILDRRWHKGIMMKARYNEHVERTPGPYDYKPNYDATTFRHAKPEFSFPKDKRFKRFPDIPGVGTYDLSRKKVGNGITMGMRTLGDHF